MRLNLNLLLDLNKFLIINQILIYICYSTDGNVAIYWDNSRSVSDDDMKESTDSFLAYRNSKKESYSITQN